MADRVGPSDFSGWWGKFKLPLAFAFVGLTLVAAGIYFSFTDFLHQNVDKDIKVSVSTPSEASSSGMIVVHLSGAVVKPGVYNLNYGTRMNELVERAGGISSEADREYIDKYLNLASVLKDGMKVYIPKVGEAGEQTSDDQIKGIQTQSQYLFVNINTASPEELNKLSGIGDVRAKKIVEGRPYGRVEELVEKGVLTQGVFEKIKERVSVN